MTIDTLRNNLRANRMLEKKAAMRLRRAQTIFDKRYSRSQDLMNQIEAIETETKKVAQRLLGE